MLVFCFGHEVDEGWGLRNGKGEHTGLRGETKGKHIWTSRRYEVSLDVSDTRVTLFAKVEEAQEEDRT